MDKADEKLERLIAAKDIALPSPEDRAKVVLDLLRNNYPDLTEWDLVCFCANYLGYISIHYAWLREEAIKVSSMVYHVHYLVPNQDVSTGLKKNDATGAQSGPPTSSDQSSRSSQHADLSLHVPDRQSSQGETDSEEADIKPLSSDN